MHNFSDAYRIFRTQYTVKPFNFVSKIFREITKKCIRELLISRKSNATYRKFRARDTFDVLRTYINVLQALFPLAVAKTQRVP